MADATPVAIVGAGPAGSGVAFALAEAGVGCVLIDDNAAAGGQVFRAGWQQSAPRSAADPRGVELRARLRRAAATIDHRPNSELVAVENGMLWLLDSDGRLGSIRFDALVVATGAIEVFAPMPGWTLPGVVGLAGLQTMLKSAGVVPAAPTVLAGAGPLLYLVATQMIEAGVPVAAVVDAAARPSPGVLAQMAARPSLLLAGLTLRLRLLRARVPVLTSTAIVEIEGGGHAEAVRVAPVDRAWRPHAGSATRIECRVVGLGLGLRPNVDVTRAAGCRHAHDLGRGGWHPERDEDGVTSVPGVFVAGDAGGITGADAAIADGAIVAVAVLRHLCQPVPSMLASEAAVARRLRARQRLFAKAIMQWSAPRPGIFDAAPADTMICRCEAVTRRALDDALAGGYEAPGPAKMATRIGMGACQGRLCHPALQAITQQRRGIAPADQGMPTVRSPLRPVPARALIAMAHARSEP
ncbi:MAG: NAD(P)/FAD-dependent oxidoreductase [Alphaproteobacteria bacterium]|nr:NAD(P)/FAD-dependent oxidoreductase [Alphaproteobacteria bacterium]